MLPFDVLVHGSQNSKEVDQQLRREQIRPVQILRADGNLEEVSFFNSWGKVGVSSIAWHSQYPNELFVSINDEIRRLNTETKEYSVLDIPNLADIHDIEVFDDVLWISNTEFDEAIAYDVHTSSILQRISLDEFRQEEEHGEDIEKAKDRFHCNQVFRDYEGNLSVLIHHVTGWQYYRIVLEMLIRRQGDGGVIDLDNKIIRPLKLQSPHSVRKIAGKYWIQDSSDQTTKIYNKNWELEGSIKTNGFGRGVAFSEEHDLALIGISATRKRYLRVIPTGEKLMNRIMPVKISTREAQPPIPIPNIEQMDNLYIFDGQLRENIERLMDV